MNSKSIIEDFDYELEKAKIRKQIKLAEYRKEYKKEIQKESINKKPIKKYRKKDPSYYFITINPSECTIVDLDSILNSIKKRKFVNIHCYIFEQRGITLNDSGKGKHIHMIIDKTIAKSDAITYIHNSIKKYCTKENIDIREITENGKIIRENYMKGHKAFEKIQSVEIDKIWRKENNLQDFYQVSKKSSSSNINTINDEELSIIQKEILDTNGYVKTDIKIDTVDNKKIISIRDENGKIQQYSVVNILHHFPY